jgi:hypothetical protein
LHIKVRFTRQLKSTSVSSKVRSARHKVDFGFQVAFYCLLYRHLKLTSVFKSHSKSPLRRHLKSTSVTSKVRSDGTTTSQAPRLNAKLLLGISPPRGLHSNYYSMITSAGFASSQARGLRTNNYSTWLLRLTWRRARGQNATIVFR